MNSTSLWICVLWLDALVFNKVETFPAVEAFIMAPFTVDYPKSNRSKIHFEPFSLMNALSCDNLLRSFFNFNSMDMDTVLILQSKAHLLPSSGSKLTWEDVMKKNCKLSAF